MSQRWRTLMEFDAPSIPGSERQVMEQVARVAAPHLSPAALQRLRTAVAEAVMNAIEHGNQGLLERKVHLRVRARAGAVEVRVKDEGGAAFIPAIAAPDIEAKLAGRDTPRGWGLFLIQHMVDRVQVQNGSGYHMMIMTFHSGDRQDERKNP